MGDRTMNPKFALKLPLIILFLALSTSACTKTAAPAPAEASPTSTENAEKTGTVPVVTKQAKDKDEKLREEFVRVEQRAQCVQEEIFKQLPADSQPTYLDLQKLTGLWLSNCGENLSPERDFQGMTNLETIEFVADIFTTLDLSSLPGIKNVSVSSSVEKLILPKNSKITHLKIKSGKPTTLNLSDASSLKFLSIDSTTDSPIVHLDLSHNPKLEALFLRYIRIQNLDISLLSELRSVHLEGLFDLESLSGLAHHPKIQDLTLLSLKSLQNEVDISHLTQLKHLELHSLNKKLSKESVNFTQYPDLESLSVSHSVTDEFQQVDLSGNKKLKKLKLSGFESQKTLNLAQQTELEEITIYNLPELTSLDFSSNPELEILNLEDVPKIESIDIRKNQKITDVYLFSTHITKTLNSSRNILKYDQKTLLEDNIGWARNDP